MDNAEKMIFTDGEVDEYDPVYSGPRLCRRCGACVRECPGGCIPSLNSGKSVRIVLDGKEICDISILRNGWKKRNHFICTCFHLG